MSEFLDQLREKADQERIAAWDRWYATLPDDLKRRLSLHDFRRLGECFRGAFNIPKINPPAPGYDRHPPLPPTPYRVQEVDDG